MARAKCPRCRKRPVLSATRGLCEVCAYRQEMGADKALVQSTLAARALEREAQAKRARKA